MHRRFAILLVVWLVLCLTRSTQGQPTELAFGPDGNLYVTGMDPGWDRVWRFDATTGDFLGYFTPDVDIESASHLAFGPDDQLDVLTYRRGQLGITRFDGTTGELLTEFGQQQFTTSRPTEAAFGPDGNLYVLRQRDWNVAKSVIRFDGATGAYLDTMMTYNVRGWLYGMAFGDDGDLYIAEQRDAELIDRIIRVNTSEGSVSDLRQPSFLRSGAIYLRPRWPSLHVRARRYAVCTSIRRHNR